jgi:hypothetical protein
VSENTGTNVKKKLYSDILPQANNSLLLDSIEIRMNTGDSLIYYGNPQFKVISPYDARSYKYHFTQYWRGINEANYSNDVIST